MVRRINGEILTQKLLKQRNGGKVEEDYREKGRNSEKDRCRNSGKE
jgi:hypothetical protein